MARLALGLVIGAVAGGACGAFGYALFFGTFNRDIFFCGTGLIIIVVGAQWLALWTLDCICACQKHFLSRRSRQEQAADG